MKLITKLFNIFSNKSHNVSNVSIVNLKYNLIRYEIAREDIFSYLSALNVTKKDVKKLEKSGVLEGIYKTITPNIEKHKRLRLEISRLSDRIDELVDEYMSINSASEKSLISEKLFLIQQRIKEKRVELLAVEVSKDVKQLKPKEKIVK